MSVMRVDLCVGRHVRVSVKQVIRLNNELLGSSGRCSVMAMSYTLSKGCNCHIAASGANREGQEQTALMGMMNEKLMTQASL